MSLSTFIKRILRLDLKTHYVSPIDTFLADFDKQNPQKSLSQQKEIAKYQRIFKLRDKPERAQKKEKIWEEF